MAYERVFNKAAKATWQRLEEEATRASASTRRLLVHIREHLFSPGFGAAELRRALPGVDDDQLERFSAELGVPVTTYVVEARIETAARLLRDTTLAIGEVSLLVGYTDDAAFREIWNNTFGLSPRVLRARLRSPILRAPGAAEDPLAIRYWQRIWSSKLPEDARHRTLELLRWLYPLNAEPEPPARPSGAAELEALANELQQQLEHRQIEEQHGLSRQAVSIDTSALLRALTGDTPSVRARLAETERLGETVAVPFLRHQLLWLAGIARQRLGQTSEAERLLRQARTGFLELRERDHAAAVSLELAALHHQQGSAAEVMSLASEAIPVLQAFADSPAAQTAADQLRQAIVADELTPEIVDRCRDCLRRLLLATAWLEAAEVPPSP